MSIQHGGRVPGYRRLPRTAALAVMASGALLLAACSSSTTTTTSGGSSSSSSSSPSSSAAAGSSKSLTLGTKDFTEEFILGSLYKLALQAKGYTITYKSNIGATEVIDKALTSGQIDAYPEYTGESVATVAGINTAPTTPQQEYGLKTTADLKKVPHFTLGARPEFQGRQEGAAGMEKVYGIHNFTFKSLALGIQYQALDSGAVNAVDVFTTDPQLATGKYVVLTDPKNIFGFQNIALVINTKKLNGLGGQAFMSLINQVNALLTTPAIIAMNKAVAVDKHQPDAVAKAFLQANHII